MAKISGLEQAAVQAVQGLVLIARHMVVFEHHPYSFEKIWHMMIDQLINGGWNVISKT